VKVHAVLIAGVIALGSSSALADPLRPIFGGVLPPTEINGIVRSMGLTPTSQPIREGLAYAVLATYLGGNRSASSSMHAQEMCFRCDGSSARAPPVTIRRRRGTVDRSGGRDRRRFRWGNRRRNPPFCRRARIGP